MDVMLRMDDAARGGRIAIEQLALVVVTISVP